MSRTLSWLAAAALLVSCLGPAAQAAEGPKMVFDQKEINFQNVKEGQELTARFFFSNQGDQNLIIDKVSPSCGCTVAEFPQVTEPGRRNSIVLKLDTTGITGAFRKTAVVAANDSSQPFTTLVMMGETAGRIKVVGGDGRRIKVAGCLGQPITTSVELISPDGSPLMISAVENPMKDYLAAHLEPLEPGRRYKLTLTATAGEPMEFAGPLFLVVPGEGKVSVFAVVEVRGPFTTQPHDLYFGGLKQGGKALGRTVLVKRACVDRLEKVRLDYNAELFEVTQDWTVPGEKLFLEVKPRLDKLPPGSFDEVLAVTAADKQYKVRLKGVVRAAP